jgi:hypothetical protein
LTRPKIPETRHVFRVKSVKQFVEIVCRQRDEWIEGPAYFDPWFRGQRCANWALEPGIFRFDLLSSEDDLRAEFQRRAPQYMTEVPPEDFWGWYFLMQHYGAPTRLLDWTDSALVALFFALHSSPNATEEDAAVWILDPWWLNRVVLETDSIMLPEDTQVKRYLAKPYSRLADGANTCVEPEFPVSIDPPFIARRVAVQRSHFTIFGHAHDGLTRLASLQGSRIIKISLAHETLGRMRADLGTLGITDSSIYPDLKGLSDELIRYHMGTWPPE